MKRTKKIRELSLRYDEPFEFPNNTHTFAIRMASAICWLPDKRTVRAYGKDPVFAYVKEDQIEVLTKYAFQWSQDNIRYEEGWTVTSIVNPVRDQCLHLGALVLIQSWAESLAKPGGPLSPYLQYHARQIYGLDHIDLIDVPPDEYDHISWNYISPEFDPKKGILDRIEHTTRSGKRTRHARLQDNISHWRTQ